MELKSQLESSLKDAMRAGDDVRKRTLRMVLSAVRLEEIEKKVQMDDAGVIAVLQKEVKSRHEAIADAQRAHRPDLESEARAEIAVLESFLPKAFTQDELEALVKEAITETSATSIKEIGTVMKVLMPRLQGRASGDQASQMVRKFLA